MITERSFLQLHELAKLAERIDAVGSSLDPVLLYYALVEFSVDIDEWSDVIVNLKKGNKVRTEEIGPLRYLMEVLSSINGYPPLKSEERVRLFEDIGNLKKRTNDKILSRERRRLIQSAEVFLEKKELMYKFMNNEYLEEHELIELLKFYLSINAKRLLSVRAKS